MKKIVILAEQHVVAGCIMSFLDVFSFCNLYWKNMYPDAVGELFTCHVVSASGNPIVLSYGVDMPTEDMSSMKDADAVIVASALIVNQGDLKHYISQFSPLFMPLREFAATGKPIASYCSGGLVLAASGLLKGKRATCVWWLADLFMQLYPDVDITMDELVVQDGQMLTAGATTANLSLALTLVKLLVGEQIATQMAKFLLIDPNRVSQLPYMTAGLMPNHNDQLVTKIQDWMQQNLTRDVLLDDIADQFALGKRTLIRRFKKAVNETPNSYMQKLRIDEAKRLLETTEMGLEQIIEQVGYADVSSFRKLFVQITSLSPSVYRRKFNTMQY